MKDKKEEKENRVAWDSNTKKTVNGYGLFLLASMVVSAAIAIQLLKFLIDAIKFN